MVSGSKGRIDEQVTKGTFYWTALSVRAVLLKLQCLRTTYLGIRFGFIQSGWGTERLHFYQVPMCPCSCWSVNHALSSKVPGVCALPHLLIAKTL